MSSKVKEAKARISKYLSYSATDQAIDKEDSMKTFKIYLECLKPSYKYILIYFVIILFDVFFDLMIPYLSGLLIRNGLERFGMLDSQGAPQPLVLGGGLNQPAMYFVWLYGGIMIGFALLAIVCQTIGMKVDSKYDK